VTSRLESNMFRCWMVALSIFLWVHSFHFYSVLQIFGPVAVGCGSYRGNTSLFYGSKEAFDYWWYYTDRASNGLCSEGFLKCDLDDQGIAAPMFAAEDGMFISRIPYWLFAFFWTALLLRGRRFVFQYSLRQLFWAKTLVVGILFCFGAGLTILLDCFLHMITIGVILNSLGIWLESVSTGRTTPKSSRE
jgi:hypothetical protein